MNDLYMAFAAAFFVPLLFQSSRVAILGLAVQGLLLAMVPASHVHDWSPQVVFECITLFALRGILAPWLLYRWAEAEWKARQFSLIGKNIFQWSIAAILMTISYQLGNKLAEGEPTEALQVGTATACILIGMLILSNQTNRLGQAIGLLTIESGMALVELLSPHAMPLPASIGVNIVYLALLFTIGVFLKQPTATSTATTLGDDKGVA